MHEYINHTCIWCTLQPHYQLLPSGHSQHCREKPTPKILHLNTDYKWHDRYLQAIFLFRWKITFLYTTHFVFRILGQLSNNNATCVSCLEESTLRTCPCINHLGWENEPDSPRWRLPLEYCHINCPRIITVHSASALFSLHSILQSLTIVNHASVAQWHLSSILHNQQQRQADFPLRSICTLHSSDYYGNHSKLGWLQDIKSVHNHWTHQFKTKVI